MTWWWMWGWGWRGAAEQGVEGALALVLGETLWFRDKGLTDAQRIRRHTQGLHSPLTGALLLSGPGSSELRTSSTTKPT